ncbi:glycosyltransferase family 4 protein [Clostridium akagii]|uniref:glycosyltransferase family 4 protein n=1 Tax=Clostridium akagii TaxID=91623 RepID=UPI00047A7098|nr:glycosyltransferase family 4 protein [Clostridium akagii]
MQNNKFLNVAFLSTWPPRQCGLATFTQDLVRAIDEIALVETNVIAVNNSEHREYSDKVIYEINQNNQGDYLELAEKLNHSKIDLLIIEHEYGIYGGDYGDYILDLVNNIEIPVMTTLHTILTEPNDKQKLIIKTLSEKSVKIITMAKNTSKLLKNIYGVSPIKIEVIHHGVPKKEVPSRQTLKDKFGYGDKQLISTFGLLSPGKGIEYAIEAIAEICAVSSDILYLVLGQTHPDQKDESYREKLQALVIKYNLEKNVKFINKYLSKDEIIQYLQMSDVYMTPYLSKDQAVSGTLAYAVGYGRAIISTPYLYAQEMLSEDRGLLAEFKNPDSIFRCMKYILDNPDEKARMEKNTINLGKTMYWDIVAKNYINVFMKTVMVNEEIGAV